MDNSDDIACSARAELERLMEGALADLVSDDLVDHPTDFEYEEIRAHPDPTVAEVLEAAARLREVTKIERLEAPALAGRLETHPETRARLLIDNQAQFQTWGLCEELLERTQQAIFSGDPHRAVRLARLATAVSDRLDGELYNGGLASDLRARAWGALGNASRCAGQLDAAEAALSRAEELLEDGSGDPLEEAHLFSLRGSLAFWLGDVDTALSHLSRAEAVYSELDEETLLSKILIQKANAAGYRDPELGVRFSREAESLIESSSEDRSVLFARHTHIFWLVESGQPERARMLLDASRSLYRRLEDPWLELRLAGVEARLLFAEGEHQAAEAALREILVREIERGLHLEALITTVEIAACRLALGDFAGAAEIAAAMAPHLRRCGAHAHAREAWALFQHALSVQRASRELIREVKSYLQLAWKNPRMRFSSQLTSDAGSL